MPEKLHLKSGHYLTWAQQHSGHNLFVVRWQLLMMTGDPGPQGSSIDALTSVHLTRLDKVLYPAARVTK